MGKLIFFGGFALGLAGCGGQFEAAKAKSDVGQHADILWVSRLDVQGRSQQPFEDPECKAVALLFFMQDCPIANSYVPEINRLHEQYAGRGVTLLVVQVDPKISVQQAAEHQQEYGLKPAVVLDQKHEWVTLAGATRTPEAAVFSREGKLLYRGRIDNRYVAVGKQRPGATKHDLADAMEAIALGRSVLQATTEAVGCYIPELIKEK